MLDDALRTASSLGLFPTSELMRAMPPPLSPSQGEGASRLAERRGRVSIPSQWAAVDAWSALQDASAALPTQPGEAAWISSAATADWPSATEEQTLDAQVRPWELRRLEHTARFALAHLA
jgi:hypothetical protein